MKFHTARAGGNDVGARGTLVHLLAEEDVGETHARAVCAMRPARASFGWVPAPGQASTCAKCQTMAAGRARMVARKAASLERNATYDLLQVLRRECVAQGILRPFRGNTTAAGRLAQAEVAWNARHRR